MNTTTTNDQTLSARLTLDVSYQLNGVPPEEMRRLLNSLVERAVGEGLLTGHTAATVEEYSMSVVMLPEPLDEDELTDLMAQRIDNGQISLEDIPNRLAKYGLMEPHSFVEEMRERMQSAEGQ